MNDRVGVTRGRLEIADAGLVRCCLQQEDPEWRFARAALPELDGWLLVLTTETGETGYGHVEAIPATTVVAEAAQASFEEVRPLLIGRDAFGINAILDDIDLALFQNNHLKSGIDCALHDLVARSLGVPLHALFGGAVQRELRMSRLIPIKSPAAMADNAADLVAKGYGALKIKLDGDSETDIARVKAIRERVGDRIQLSVDPNQAYSVRGAILTLNQLSPLGVDLAEQPIPAGDLAGMRFVRENISMWLEADECARSPRDVLEIFALGAADSVNLKVADLGGLRAAALVAKICHSAGIGYRMGAAFGPQLLNAQAAHLASTFSNHFYPHEIAEFEHFTGDPSSGLAVTDGILTVEDRLGSGVDVRLGNLNGV